MDNTAVKEGAPRRIINTLEAEKRMPRNFSDEIEIASHAPPEFQ